MHLKFIELRLKRLVATMMLVNAFLVVALALLLIGQRTGLFFVTDSSSAKADRLTAPANIDFIAMDRVSSETRGKAPFRTYRTIETKVVDELGRYQLLGISVSGEMRRAFVKDSKQNRSFSVGAGESLGTFQVLEVIDDGIRLQQDADEVVLKRR